jgi:hypothetical protein
MSTIATIPGGRRFITKDPTRIISEDANYFGYVQNNSVNFIDPEGLYGIPGAIGGATLNFSIQFGANLILTKGDLQKSLKCIDWMDVGISAAMGAIGPTFLANIVGGKAGPYGLTWAKNAEWYFSTSLPTGSLLKIAMPRLTIGNDCECQGLSPSKVISKIAGP